MPGNPEEALRRQLHDLGLSHDDLFLTTRDEASDGPGDGEVTVDVDEIVAHILGDSIFSDSETLGYDERTSTLFVVGVGALGRQWNLVARGPQADLYNALLSLGMQPRWDWLRDAATEDVEFVRKLGRSTPEAVAESEMGAFLRATPDRRDKALALRGLVKGHDVSDLLQ